jgi:hypothetical protein
MRSRLDLVVPRPGVGRQQHVLAPGPVGTARGGSARSSRTTPLPWDSRVVVRSRTGVSNRSDSSNAARVNSRASSGVAGSSSGMRAARA